MMEKHKCKLCLRNFSNGRALGGHMRSHMMNLPIPPKRNESPPPPPPPAIQLSFEAESASSPSSSYGLRENPKRSSRLADPEFFDAGSVILQDRESETESSKNPTRRRSKRKPREMSNESASSASDTTTEEDVAFCLMMLSRDRWKIQRQQPQQQHHHHESMEEEEEEEKYEEEEEESDDESEELKPSKGNTRVRGRYKCDTCNKVFRSYQALGGHRASHKKIKVVVEEPESEEHENTNNNNNNNVVGKGSCSVPLVEKKIHECPVCFRVFASGQALGGHKRTHVIGSTPTATVTAATATATTTAKFGDSLIDLNLPAPIDDDDASQFEDSAVSDAEFVKSR